MPPGGPGLHEEAAVDPQGFAAVPGPVDAALELDPEPEGAGESGVGKTPAARPSWSAARASRARPSSAATRIELGEGELPYAPLVGALRPLARGDDAVLGELGPANRASSRALLPELARRDAAAPGTDRARPGARSSRRCSRCSSALGEQSPVVLALEDLHWADRSTRAFLAFLARSLCGERVLVVATYRSDELHRRHPLRPLLAELERGPRARRIELARSTATSWPSSSPTSSARRPTPASSTACSRAARATRCSPRSSWPPASTAAAGCPPTLRDALMVRVERARRRRAGGAARCSRRRARSTTSCSRTPAASSRARCATRCATPSPATSSSRPTTARYALPPRAAARGRRRRPAPRRALRAAPRARARARAPLRRGRHGAHLAARIAHHYRAARRPARAALAPRCAAARAAERVQAHGEAAALLERALELWDRVDEPESPGRRRPRRRCWSAAATRTPCDGDDARAEALYGAALAEIDEHAEPPPRRARCSSASPRPRWRLGRGEDGRATLDAGLALLPRRRASVERARLLLVRRGSHPAAQWPLRRAEDGRGGARRRRRRGRPDRPHPRAQRARRRPHVRRRPSDEGAARLREAHGRRRGGRRSTASVISAYVNLADVLHLVGRRRGRGARRRGRGVGGRAPPAAGLDRA